MSAFAGSHNRDFWPCIWTILIYNVFNSNIFYSFNAIICLVESTPSRDAVFKVTGLLRNPTTSALLSVVCLLKIPLMEQFS